MFDYSPKRFSGSAAKRLALNPLLCTSSMLTLAACAGGGGGGFSGLVSSAGGVGGGVNALMGGLLVKGTVVGARIFQDLNLDGRYSPGEPSAITDSEGKYSLEFDPDNAAPVMIDEDMPGVDITTGAAPGRMMFAAKSGSDLVSTPLSFLNEEFGGAQVSSVVAGLPSTDSAGSTLDLDEFNPIAEAAESQTRTSGDTSDAQYVVASQVDAVSAQVQLVLNSLEAVLSSSDVNDSAPANSSKKAFIDAYTTKGSALDLTSANDIASIFNSADAIAQAGGFSNIITQISSVVSAANSQINNQRNDFFADGGRASALVAQDTVVAGIDELLRSPNDAAANAFSSGFDPASLATEFEASLPTFNVAAGKGSEIIAALDRTLVEKNQSTGPFNVLANDKHLSDGTFGITGIYGFKTDALADSNPHTLDVGQSENQINPFNTISGNFYSSIKIIDE